MPPRGGRPPARHCDSRACSNFYQVSGACLFPAATTPYVRDSENVQEAWYLTHNAAELSSVPPPLHPRAVQPGSSRAGWEAAGSPSLSAHSGLQFSWRRAISTRPFSSFQPPALRRVRDLAWGAGTDLLPLPAFCTSSN